MKKIFLSLAIIITVSSFSFILTRAYFSDRKTSSGNKFTVGTLDLQVGDSQNKQVEPFVISDLGTGKIAGQKIWKLKNTGSLSGQFIAELSNISDNENGCNAPEKEIDQTCDNPGVGQGDLGKLISVNLYVDNVLKTTFPLTDSGITSLENYWSNNKFILNPGQESELKIEWFETGDYGNEIQSDSLSFDLNFNLQQVIN
jgi:hypothetical protein